MFIQKHNIPILLFFLFTAFIGQSCNRTPKENKENTLASASLSKDYTAKGNEPFWAVTIEKPAIVFQTPEQQVHYPYHLPTEANNILIFESNVTSDTLNSRIRITISVNQCFDSMSGEAYPFTATVTKDDTTYTGCAKEAM